MATPRNPMAPAVTSPFGNNGQNVVNPVPPEAIALQQAQDNAQTVQALDMNALNQNGLMTPEQAAMTPAPVQQAPASLDDLFAQFDAEDAAMSTEAEPTGFASAAEQFREAGARIRNSFAVTPAEQVQTLRDTGIFDDVRPGADGVEVKRRGRQGWEKFDRDKLELLGDTLDWARDALEMGVEAGTEIAGTIAGAVGGAGVGAIPANALAGAGGAVAAKNFGDAVARNLLGIKTDPERSLPTENAVAGAIGAGFGWLGSTLARRNAQRLATKAAGDKSLSNTLAQVAETMDDIDVVRKSGINIDGDGKFRADLNLATGGQNPEAKAQASWLSDTDGYRNFATEMGDKIKGAYNSLAESVANLAGKNASIGEDFVLSAETVRKAEGKLIGDFVNFADKATRSRKQPTPRTLQTLQAFGQELGDARGRITVESAIENFALDEGKAKNLVAKINKAKLMSGRGAMSVDNAKILYDDLTRQINRMSGAELSSTHGRALIDLKNAVRDDWVDMVENVLPESQKGNFMQSRARYREIMQATDNLGRVLDSSDISKDALVKQMFEGQKAWQNIKGAKTLIEETNPELWSNLAGEYFNRSIRMATDEVGNVNFKQVANNWKKLDPRVQEELAKATGFNIEGINALHSLGQKYQNSTVQFMAKQSEQGAIKAGIKNLISLVWGGGAAQGTAAANQIGNIGKDQALMKWLQADGNMAQIAKELGRSNPGFMKAFENAVYNWTPRAVTKPAQTSFRREVENER